MRRTRQANARLVLDGTVVGELVSGLLCWHAGLSLSPFFIFQVTPMHPVLSLALSHARVALSHARVFIRGRRERRESSSTYSPRGSPYMALNPTPLSSQALSTREGRA